MYRTFVPGLSFYCTVYSERSEGHSCNSTWLLFHAAIATN